MRKPTVCINDVKEISDASQTVGKVPSHRLIAYYSPTTGRVRYTECIGGELYSDIGAGIIPGELVVVVEHHMTPQELADKIVQTYDLWHSGQDENELKKQDPANSLYLRELDGMEVSYDDEDAAWHAGPYGCDYRDDSYADEDEVFDDDPLAYLYDGKDK